MEDYGLPKTQPFSVLLLVESSHFSLLRLLQFTVCIQKRCLLACNAECMRRCLGVSTVVLWIPSLFEASGFMGAAYRSMTVLGSSGHLGHQPPFIKHTTSRFHSRPPVASEESFMNEQFFRSSARGNLPSATLGHLGFDNNLYFNLSSLFRPSGFHRKYTHLLPHYLLSCSLLHES